MANSSSTSSPNESTIFEKVQITSGQRAWLVAALFIFMLLHQTDKLLISPLTTPIMETFKIDEAQMGLVFTGALLVGGVFFPLWGYLFDRFARPKILALAALLWGSTTWLSALAGSFGIFAITRASTGIDDASYPGVYSLVSDTFSPRKRGKVISLLQLTSVIGGIIAMGMATAFRDTIGWRGVFYITGSLGLVWAVVMFFTMKDVPRGQSEPEMETTQKVVSEPFSWKTVGILLRRPIIIMLFIQQFFYVFPFWAINSWYFRFLETEGHLTPMRTTIVMGVFAIMVAIGTVAAGALGDWAFKRTPRGRLLVAIAGIAMLIVFFTTALRLATGRFEIFFILQTIGAFFWSFEWPNAVSTVQDIVEPEIRSTAHAVIGIGETIGSALSPLVAGLIAVGSSLQNALLTITTTGWGVGIVLLVVVMVMVPREVMALRKKMQERVQKLEIS